MAAISVYVPLFDQQIGLSSFSTMLVDMGVEVTPIKDAALYAFPISNRGTISCADHPKYMSREALDTLTYKSELHKAGIPTIPTEIVQEIGDTSLYFFSPNSIFITEIVKRPRLAVPLLQYEVTFSVNEFNEIYIFGTAKHIFKKEDVSGASELIPEDGIESAYMIDQVRQAIIRLNIRGGIHNVQFVYYNGGLVLLDWNARPPAGLPDGLALSNHPNIVSMLRHMFGLSVLPREPMSIVFRDYYDTPIPVSKRDLIISFGLLPRKVWGAGIDYPFIRVSGIGYSDEELNSKFDQMELAVFAD